MQASLSCIQVLFSLALLLQSTIGYLLSARSPSFQKLYNQCRSTPLSAVSTSGMWNSGLSFGKGTFRFYKSFKDWMAPFPQEDRNAYPELFNLPLGVYEVSLRRPLGIIFEEIELGRGVYVKELVEGGNADLQGQIQEEDILIGVTAVKVVGAKWERRLIPAKDLSFDVVVGAIGSNEEKWGCTDTVLMFARTSVKDYDPAKVDSFIQFFNPPGDSPWRVG